MREELQPFDVWCCTSACARGIYRLLLWHMWLLCRQPKQGHNNWPLNFRRIGAWKASCFLHLSRFLGFRCWSRRPLNFRRIFVAQTLGLHQLG